MPLPTSDQIYDPEYWRFRADEALRLSHESDAAWERNGFRKIAEQFEKIAEQTAADVLMYRGR